MIFKSEWIHSFQFYLVRDNVKRRFYPIIMGIGWGVQGFSPWLDGSWKVASHRRCKTQVNSPSLSMECGNEANRQARPFFCSLSEAVNNLTLVTKVTNIQWKKIERLHKCVSNGRLPLRSRPYPSEKDHIFHVHGCGWCRLYCCFFRLSSWHSLSVMNLRVS